MRLGVYTANQEHAELPPQAAMRELPENAMSIAAKLPADAPPVGYCAYIKDVIVRKSGEPNDKPDRMLVSILQTKYKDNDWDETTKIFNPKPCDERSHDASKHGKGTINAAIGAARSGRTSQCVMFRLKARGVDGRSRGSYPFDVTLHRFGKHADVMHAEQNGGEEARATIPGKLLIREDKRAGANCTWSATFVDEDQVEPTNQGEYIKLVKRRQSATEDYLLDDSPWGLGDDTLLGLDLCDGLVGEIEKALDNLAAKVGQTPTVVRERDCVIYFSWDLRDEIAMDDTGAILVAGEALHTTLANTWLPSDSPTRDYLKGLDKPMMDPHRVLMHVGNHQVEWSEHWVTQAVADGKLVPVSYAQGQGQDNRVRVVDVADGIVCIESYTVADDALLTCGVEEPIVQVHTDSGLAIGNRNDFMQTRVAKDARELQNKLDATNRFFTNVMKPNSFTNWSKHAGNFERGNKFNDGLDSMLPEGHGWTDGERAEFKQALHASRVLYGGGEASASANSAADAAWANRDQSDGVGMYEFYCRLEKPCLKSQTALSHIGYMLTGRNIVHIITILDKGLQLDKSKMCIIDNPPAMLAIAATLPRLNKEIVVSKINQLSEWKQATLDAAAAARAAARAAKDAADAAERAQRDADRAAAKRLAAREAADQAQKEQNAKMNRMRVAGCCPKKVGNQVSFKSGTAFFMTMDIKTADAQLRAGTLLLTGGNSQGKYAMYDPRITRTRLFKPTGGAPDTEIVINPQPPPPAAAAAPPPAAAPPARPAPALRAQPPRGVRLVAPAAPSPPLVPIPFKFTDGSDFAFMVPSDASPAFLGELQNGTHNNTVAFFSSAVRGTPRIMECIDSEGGLPLKRDNKKYALRIVPVLLDQAVDFEATFPTKLVVSGDVMVVTWFANVASLSTRMPVALSDEMRLACLGCEINYTAARGYACVIVDPPHAGDPIAANQNAYDLTMALLGRMAMTKWQTPADAQGIQVASRAIPAALGKRRAPNAPEEEPPAQRAGSPGRVEL